MRKEQKRNYPKKNPFLHFLVAKLLYLFNVIEKSNQKNKNVINPMCICILSTFFYSLTVKLIHANRLVDT